MVVWNAALLCLNDLQNDIWCYLYHISADCTSGSVKVDLPLMLVTPLLYCDWNISQWVSDVICIISLLTTSRIYQWNSGDSEISAGCASWSIHGPLLYATALLAIPSVVIYGPLIFNSMSTGCTQRIYLLTSDGSYMSTGCTLSYWPLMIPCLLAVP